MDGGGRLVAFASRPSCCRTLSLAAVLCVLLIRRYTQPPREEARPQIMMAPPVEEDEPPTPTPTAASARAPRGPLPAHAALFERAFFINADDSPRRRAFMEQQLEAAGVRYERWPAVRGSPSLLRTHERYFARGVERHLYANRTAASGAIVQWGTIGTYLSHHTLFESIVARWGANDSATFLILQVTGRTLAHSLHPIR